MTTIPSRLAQLSRTSGSATIARQNVLKLYRDWYRAAPEIGALYALTISPAEIRRVVRRQFENNRYISDPKVIDVLIHKGRLELQETLNCWKQEPHILGILLNPPERPQRSFLQKFYEGRDEDQVLPAASGMY
ncbi:NdufA6 NADH-ubiquinone oxidoreductase 14.8 kDa subunit [Rickenella mellea]|uniref:NdufA6 NADH-ubiquinone oxidoreductase 14.8 kDa subunit n=1 Tax=Rickenella mellea TaxID=50990 RepID=A0A4Y7QHP2_9AGAM|nr:NdufA6 NADH-ubiquinone oxidoreductase 14.8 kDa subunit [Rickenella mellea]